MPFAVKVPAASPCIMISPSVPVLPVIGSYLCSLVLLNPKKLDSSYLFLSNPNIVHSYSKATFCGLLETLPKVKIVGCSSLGGLLNLATVASTLSLPSFVSALAPETSLMVSLLSNPKFFGFGKGESIVIFYSVPLFVKRLYKKLKSFSPPAK